MHFQIIIEFAVRIFNLYFEEDKELAGEEVSI